MKFVSDIHGAWRMNPNYFSVPLSVRLIEEIEIYWNISTSTKIGQEYIQVQICLYTYWQVKMRGSVPNIM